MLSLAILAELFTRFQPHYWFVNVFQISSQTEGYFINALSYSLHAFSTSFWTNHAAWNSLWWWIHECIMSKSWYYADEYQRRRKHLKLGGGHNTSTARFSLRRRGHLLNMKRALLCLLKNLGGHVPPVPPGSYVSDGVAANQIRQNPVENTESSV